MGTRKPTASKPPTGLSSDTTNRRTRSVNRTPDPVIDPGIHPGVPSSSKVYRSTSSSSHTDVFNVNDPSISTRVAIHAESEFEAQDTGKAVSHNPVLEGTPSSQLTNPQPQLSVAEVTKLFNAAYNEFYRNNKLSERTRKLMEAQDVDIDLFDRLTLKKQNQRYISLLDGRVIFHEVPNAPHGQVIDKLRDIIWRQVDHNIFQGCSDNDLPLSNRCKKRPDTSFGIRRSEIPNPRPPWLKLLPNNPFGLP